MLEGPAEEDLGFGDVVGGSDGGEDGVAGATVADKGCIGFEDDVLGFAVVDDAALLEPGVELGGH